MDGVTCRPMGECGRALRDAHLNDDETVVKMGHPVVQVRGSARLRRREYVDSWGVSLTGRCGYAMLRG
jgi:hypothetical protein